MKGFQVKVDKIGKMVNTKTMTTLPDLKFD